MKMLLVAVAAFALLGTPLVVAGDTSYATIVASTVPDLPAGRVISDTEQIYVPPNASVSLVFRDGHRLTVKGPMFGIVEPGLTPGTSDSPYLMLGHDAGAIGGARTFDGRRAARLDDPRITHDFDR